MKRLKMPKVITLKLDARLTRRLGIYDKVEKMLEDPKKSRNWSPIHVVSVVNELAEWRDQLTEHLLKIFNYKYPTTQYRR